MQRTKKPNWDPIINNIETFFASIELPESVQLDGCTRIVGVKGFVDKHLAVVRGHNGNKTFKPYLMRLMRLKAIIENNLE